MTRPSAQPSPLVALPGGADRVDLSSCESEPIHIPGSIQPHGALVVASASNLRVLFVSQNIESYLGKPAAGILGKPLYDCLRSEIYQKLIRLNEQGQAGHEPIRTYRMVLDGSNWYFEVRHWNDLLYIEIERDIHEPDPELLPAITQNMVLHMRSATSIPDLLQIAASELRRLTGYDRVMTYRFEADGHGVVVAEDRDPELEPYLGLHYPASDIPPQARRLYLMQRIRAVVDVAYQPVPILADGSLADANGKTPALDLSFCNLRSVSPVHLEYLRNMGVSSTLALSLIVDDDLWGMMVCHHRTPKLPSPSIQSSCDLFSQMTSFLIRARSEMDSREVALSTACRIEEIAAHLDQRRDICEALSGAEDQVLGLVGATGALVSFEGKSDLIGTTPPVKDCVQLMSRLHSAGGGKVFAHSSLQELLPQFGRLKLCASGAMLMPILGSPENAILWFRPEYIETVLWGGNPDKSVEVNPETNKISPRHSFEAWKVQVEGRCTPWTAADFRAAGELRRTISDYLLAKAEGTFSDLGLVDTLTLLPNRRRLQSELRIRLEDPESHVAVILINLDRFKMVNEAFGHTAGDHLLLQVTRRLGKLVSGGVLLARLGADEFAILCSGDMAALADQVAGRVNEAFATPFQIAGKPFHITASLGVAHAAHGEKDLLRAADTAMHFAKRSGRNRLVAFSELLRETAVKNLELQQDMYRALEAQEFKPVYQPIVSLSDGTLHGFEALVRWHHPMKGMIPPLDFIPLAEETGLILQIGKGVLREAIRMTQYWTGRFGLPLKIHVNVAAPQLIGDAFVDDVKAALEQYQLDPSALSIEVTESVLMRDQAVESLRALKETGIEVSIDDFGTGYSSLAYLEKLPIDIVKVDKTFINDIEQNARSREFLRALVKLTQTLGLKSIAEGIETVPQKELLLDFGCGLAQGYLFSRPLDERAVEALIASSKLSGWKLPTA